MGWKVKNSTSSAKQPLSPKEWAEDFLANFSWNSLISKSECQIYLQRGQGLTQKWQTFKQIRNKSTWASITRRALAGIQEEDGSSSSRVGKRGRERQWAWLLPLFVRQHLGPLGVFSGSYTGCLKPVDCQIFLQQRWVYSGSTENCNSGSATVARHIQFLHGKGRRIFIERKWKVGGPVNTESMAFLWLTLYQERRVVFLLPVVFCYPWRAWKLPLLVSQLYFIDVSVY